MSDPHIYLMSGEVSVLVPLPETWADLTEVSKIEFDVVPRYVEFRTILDGQPTSSRASESGWQALRKDLEQSGGGSRKPVLRITT